jgi:adenylate cyclase class 2
MLEIEQKFVVTDFRPLEAKLRSWKAAPGKTVEEADHYFNAPDRDFAKTGEAFRMRCVGAQSWLTYKGPKRTGPVKIRTEIELPLAEGEKVAEEFRFLLQCLGYRFVAVVRKKRTPWSFQRDGFAMTLCCDVVEGLGNFAEVEVMAEDDQADAARDLVAKVAGELGLTQLETRSYLRMVLEAQSGEGKRG